MLQFCLGDEHILRQGTNVQYTDKKLPNLRRQEQKNIFNYNW